AEKGYDPTFGARPLRRTIQTMIEDPLAEKILHGEFTSGDKVYIAKEDDGIVFQSASMVAPTA
ncbi:MAG: hypothetical protein R6U89_08350, partial [Dehalococcoidia bacterium]